MIDAAPAGSEQDLLAHMQQSNMSNLDYIIVTCPTAEHIGCLPTLMSGISCEELLTPGCSSPLMSKLEQALLSSGGKVKTVRSGSVVPLDDKCEIEVLAPASTTKVPANADQDWYDNHSLIFRLKFGLSSILFTSDMGPTERTWLCDSGVDLHSGVLAGLHHGDRRVTDLEFVHYIRPTILILMCQPLKKKVYPHAEALEAMNSNLATVFRTDVQASIKVQMQSAGQISASSDRSGSLKEMKMSGSEMKHDVRIESAPTMTNPLDQREQLN